MKFLALISILSIFLVGCATDFSKFYDPWYEDGEIPEEAFLEDGESPTIIKTSDLITKYREISSNWYWSIGYTGFNGPNKDDYFVHQELIQLCKKKKAKIAIWERKYTNTQNGVYSVPHTQYHSHIDYNGYAHTYATTSYSAHSYSIDRYDFSAYLFVSIPQSYRMQYAPGFAISDLSQRDREQSGQNTGALINIVYKNTVAYFANILHGDVITQINDRKIYTKNDFYAIRHSAKIGDIWNMTLVRNGRTLNVSLKYGL